jgi:methylglutaconyl-CoA hydratase
MIQRDFSGAVARLTLDSPHNRNALSTQLLTELNDGLDAAQADAAIRAIVLTGAGPVFCSGADLKEQRQYKESGEESPVAGLFAGALMKILESPKPVLARINGHARAGGLGLIGAADIAIAPKEATFGFAEVRLGLVPAVISVTCVPRMTERAALELFLTGENFDGERAVEIGLINRAVDDLDAEVDRYLEMLLLGGPQALAAIKPMLRTVRENAPAFPEMAALSTRTFASDEGQEGLRSFAEKRKPSWVSE